MSCDCVHIEFFFAEVRKEAQNNIKHESKQQIVPAQPYLKACHEITSIQVWVFALLTN